MSPAEPSDDLEVSDTLMVKADALIHRHRPSIAPTPDDLPVLTDVLGEDLPVLDDVAEHIALDDELPPADLVVPEMPRQELVTPAAVIVAPDPAVIAAAADAAAKAAREEAAALADAAKMRMAEQLIEFDAHIAQTLESWISNELPQIVAAEVDGMVERLRIKTLAHMRATLVPDLSHKLSELLDATLNTPRQD